MQPPGMHWFPLYFDLDCSIYCRLEAMLGGPDPEPFNSDAGVAASVAASHKWEARHCRLESMLGGS